MPSRSASNIATTEGSVVYRNRMMELIQYAPTTETVHRTPLVIFPPWINKFYIMDLKPQNSLIRWIVDQGYTLFVVSWKNPDASYADVGLEQYVEEGYLEAVRVAREITGEKQVNAIGYCIAGTTLTATLALLKKRKEKPIKSATFFTTLTDFSDQGEFTVFLQDDFVDAIERQVEAEGLLDSYYMSKTFSFLRAKDLVYGPAVRSYMMGEAPPAFDLLYWNGDSTNLPGKHGGAVPARPVPGQPAERGHAGAVRRNAVGRTWMCRSMPSPARPTISRPGRTAFAGW
jgi:polyhydroxyalkanoate synthase